MVPTDYNYKTRKNLSWVGYEPGSSLYMSCTLTDYVTEASAYRFFFFFLDTVPTHAYTESSLLKDVVQLV